MSQLVATVGRLGRPPPDLCCLNWLATLRAILVAFATRNLVAAVLRGIYAPTQLLTHARCPTPTFRKPEIQKSIELFVSRCGSSGCLSTSLQQILTDQRLPYTSGGSVRGVYLKHY